MSAHTTINTRQFGQMLRNMSAESKAHLHGVWKCKRHPRRKLGVTESVWSKGDSVCEEKCGPSMVTYPALNVTVDLSK